MKRILFLLSTFMILVVFPISGCNSPIASEISFNQLLANPTKYSGRNITVEAFYFHGFEANVLAGNLKQSGHAAGHFVPEGDVVWVEGGIPLEVYNQLPQQQMMGPQERYGKVRVTGKFHSDGHYGHLGNYEYQIAPSEVVLVPWSPK